MHVFPATPGVLPAGTTAYHLPAKEELHNARAQTPRHASAAALKVTVTVRGFCVLLAPLLIRRDLSSSGRRVLFPSTCCERCVDAPPPLSYLCVSVCWEARSPKGTQRLLSSAGSGKASCWNRVPLYVRNVCRTHSHTQAGALTCTSERAGAAHAGVNQHADPSQRIIDSFSASLEQVSEALMHQASEMCPLSSPQSQKLTVLSSRGSLLSFRLLTVLIYFFISFSLPKS